MRVTRFQSFLLSVGHDLRAGDCQFVGLLGQTGDDIRHPAAHQYFRKIVSPIDGYLRSPANSVKGKYRIFKVLTPIQRAGRIPALNDSWA